jgi:hypothetical protein
MFWRKGFILFLTLSLLSCILNYVARKQMNYSYADQLGYNQLYMVKEQLKILQLKENKDHSVTVVFGGKGVRKENDYKVYLDNRLLTSSHGPSLTFHPVEGTKQYFIRLNDVKNDIVIDLCYSPDSLFKKAGNDMAGGCEFLNVNIPVEQGHVYSLNDWAWHYNNFDSDEKLAASYLKDSIKILPGDSTMARAVKIARFILERTKGMDGTPSDSIDLLSPIEQLKYIHAGRSKIWCGIYASLFTYFACKAGVPTRIIQCGDFRMNISSGIHVFNEVYIEEYGGWLYLDLLAKTIFVKKGGQFLNVADIHRLLKYNIDDEDLAAVYFNGDSIVQTPFNQVASTARLYFHSTNTFTYYFGNFLKIQTPRNLLERCKKAVYSKPYYALYSDNISIGKSQFIFRLVTTYALMLFLGLCLLFGVVAYRVRRN